MQFLWNYTKTVFFNTPLSLPGFWFVTTNCQPPTSPPPSKKGRVCFSRDCACVYFAYVFWMHPFESAKKPTWMDLQILSFSLAHGVWSSKSKRAVKSSGLKLRSIVHRHTMYIYTCLIHVYIYIHVHIYTYTYRFICISCLYIYIYMYIL